MNGYQKLLTLLEITFIAVIIYLLGASTTALKYIIPTGILYLIFLFMLKRGKV